jgi:hypothetical protein
MKINDILKEKDQSGDKKPGLIRRGLGAVDRAIGPDSGLARFIGRAQQQTKRPGPKSPIDAVPVSVKKGQKQTGRPGAKRSSAATGKRAGMIGSVQSIPDNAVFHDKASNSVYRYDSDSKKWVNPKNPRDTLSPKAGISKHNAAMKESTITEGGAMPGVGAIHISEVGPTVEMLEKALGVPLKNYLLGSAGKNQFSGDIDIALKLETEEIPKFVEKLEQTPEVLEVQKTSVIMTKVKIINYDPDIETDKPRTGFVQVDFMPGDPDWLKVFYHSPSEKESKYKGVYRNIMLSTIAAFHDKKASEETVDDGRPMEVERWLWSSSDGLVRVKRTPVPKAKGDGYTKKNQNEIIQEPIKRPDEIARALNLGTADSLQSFETLLAAIEKNYPSEVVEKIKQSFADNSIIKNLGVPDELADSDKTESLGDKHLSRIKQLVSNMP